MINKIEKLNKVFMNSWKRFEMKKDYSFDQMLDLFMQNQLSKNEYRMWRTERSAGYNDLMDDVFEPDMTDRNRELSMQERLRAEASEPEMFGEKIVGEWWNGIATNHDQLDYSPFEL